MTKKQRTAAPHSFVRTLTLTAPAERIFAAIATLDGLRGWWTPLVQGDTTKGGEVRFEFEGLPGQYIIMHVDEAERFTKVEWTCRIHSALPEWSDTRVVWTLRPVGEQRCELHLEHVGLTPALECYGHCEAGWNRFLGSLGAYVETGAGMPFRATNGVCEAREGDATATNDALAVVRAYHRAWTTKDFGAAARLLAPNLRVEVPINDHPTAESFAQAVQGFGSLVKQVNLLAEFSQGDEAMLLYDLDVERVGIMRVAEHFTVEQGRITAVRQIHDTAAVRAAGFAQPSTTTA